MSWNNIQQTDNFDSYLEELSEPIVEPPKPDIKTVMVDIATETEKPETYIQPVDQEKRFEEKKKEGFSMAPPVDIYEPGFRSDMYEAMLNYFKQRKADKQRLQALREKIGLRS